MSDQNKPLPMYNLSRDGFTLVCMGFVGAKALEFKIAYIHAFATMEKSLVQLEGKSTGQALYGNNNSRVLFNHDRDTWLKTDFGFCDRDLELITTNLSNFATRLDGVFAEDRATEFREGFIEQYYQILARSRDKQKVMTPAYRLAHALYLLSDFAFNKLDDINESLLKMGQKAV